MNENRRPLRSLAVCGAFVLAAVLPAVAQDEPASLFGEIIDVRVVNLEVVVTRGGERVSGLSPDDFVLKVDGREVPIEYFTEVQGGAAVATGDEAASSTIPALAPGEPVSTSYLVFIDDYFTKAALRNRILDGLREQVAAMQPRDRMAVVAFDGRQLEMLTTWTQSSGHILRVLEEARQRPTRGPGAEAERRMNATDASAYDPAISRPGDPQQQAAGGAGAPEGPAARGVEMTDAEQVVLDMFGGVPMAAVVPDLQTEQEISILENQLKKVIAAVTSSLRGFANPPGRKVMLMVSGGWPYSPAEWAGADVARGYAGFKAGRDLYHPIMETANRLSYTIYPVDVPFVSDPTRLEDLRSTLRLIAEDTGGRPLIGAASFNAFDEVVEDTRNYYWIGFTPNWKGDDEDHKIRLEARERGLKVRSRTGFSDLSRQQEVSMMVESTLLLGNAPPTAAPMPSRVGTMKAAKRGQVEVPVEVLVPMWTLTFIPSGEQYVAQAELRIAVQDDRGTMLSSDVVPMEITLDHAPKEGEMRRWGTTLTLRKVRHDVLLSLYDPVAGSFLTSRLEVIPE